LHAELNESVVLGSNCCQFRRSDKGKITGVKADYHPLTLEIREPDVLEPAFVVGTGFKIGCGFPYFGLHLLHLLDGGFLPLALLFCHTDYSLGRLYTTFNFFGHLVILLSWGSSWKIL
jgi:hypothetical protein